MLSILELYLFIVVGISGLSCVYFILKFDYRVDSVIIIHFLVGDILVFVTANFLDILYYPNLVPSNESLMNLQILIFTGFVMIVIISLLFLNNLFGQRSNRFALINLILSSMSVGIISHAISTNSMESVFLSFVIEMGEWLIDFKPLFLILTSIIAIIQSIVIYFGVQHLNMVKSVLPDSYKFEYLFGGSIILIVFTLIIDEPIRTILGKLAFIIGLILLFSSIIYFFSKIISHPVASVYLNMSATSLIENKLVSIVLYSNKETGPEILYQSTDIINKDINQAELHKFGVQTLMMAYNDNKYVENISIAPFAARSDYFALSLSFIAKDKQITDSRFGNRSQSSLVLLLPTKLLSIFTKPLLNIQYVNEITDNYDLNATDISTISEEKFVMNLSRSILNALL